MNYFLLIFPHGISIVTYVYINVNCLCKIFHLCFFKSFSEYFMAEYEFRHNFSYDGYLIILNNFVRHMYAFSLLHRKVFFRIALHTYVYSPMHAFRTAKHPILSGKYRRIRHFSGFFYAYLTKFFLLNGVRHKKSCKMNKMW